MKRHYLSKATPARQIINLTSFLAVVLFAFTATRALAASSVIGWGDNRSEQLNPPTDLRDPVAIAAGATHALALSSSGLTSLWGDNHSGELDVPDWITAARAVAAGDSFSAVLANDGSVLAWGNAEQDQCATPFGETNFVAISVGHNHGLALRSDGTVAAWGNKSLGQCDVPEDLGGVKAILAGYNYSAALTSNGNLVVWGDANQVAVPSGTSGLVSIGGGKGFLVGLRGDRTVKVWGVDAAALAVPAGLSNVVSISTHSPLALRADGSVVAWGSNDFGQAAVPTGLKNVKAIDGNGTFNLVIADAVAAAPALTLIAPALNTQSFSVKILSQSGVSYILEYRDSMQSGAWTPLPAVPGPGGLLTLTDSSPAAPGRFYRVRQE